jgi:signal transduction histidine kinase/CheY-like chemotaxis protein
MTTARPSTGESRFRLSRNLTMQVVGVTLVSLASLRVLPAPVVACWALALLACSWLEDTFARRAALAGAAARRLRVASAALRVLSSMLWAGAAMALIVRGDPAERTLAFALMAVSMVNVMMRYYHSRLIFLIGISPHLAVLSLVAWGLSAKALARGELLAAFTPVAVVLLFAMLFWVSRAQLAETWTELLKATAEAREGERTAREADLAKSNFLATMGHELRTPLNGVLGMAQAMGAGKLSDEQRAQLKVIRRSGESLSSVLNDLLDISKIEAGALELESTVFDLDHLARGVVFAYGHQAEKKGLTFTFEIEESASGAYRGDSARLRQVLYNLLSNAVKFTEAGEIALRIGGGAEAVTLTVSDTGAGIAPEDLGRLFDTFFQADASNSRRFGGAGLGLTICHELVTLMGGKIEAGSVLGQGSSFVVTLPLERVADDLDPAGMAPAPEVLAAIEEPARIRLLVAEDNEVNQLVLKALLAQAGIVPTIVADGDQAVIAWERDSWDVILMDIQMPNRDGIAATREIRRREAKTGRPRTPILAVTANAMTHQVAQYRAAGMDALVAKPIQIGALFSAIEAALAQARDGAGEVKALG